MSFTSSAGLLNNRARYLTSCSLALPAWARSVSLMLMVCRQGLNPDTPEYRAPGLTSTRMVTPSGTALKAPASCIEFDKQIVGLCPDALTPKAHSNEIFAVTFSYPRARAYCDLCHYGGVLLSSKRLCRQLKRGPMRN